MQHPSLFQIKEVSDRAAAAQRLVGVVNPDTARRLDVLLRSQADASLTSSQASRQKPTLLRLVFFCDANLKGILQQLIRAEVKEKTGKVIGDQYGPQFLEVIDDVYEEYSQPVNEAAAPWADLQKYVKSEVARLNRVVLDILVPRIVASMYQYAMYIEKNPLDKTIEVPERPTFTSSSFKNKTIDLTTRF